MSLGGVDLGGLVGTLVFGAIAVKGIDTLGKVATNAGQPQQKKKKKTKQNNQNVFDFGNAFEPYPKQKKVKSQDVFSTGFF